MDGGREKREGGREMYKRETGGGLISNLNVSAPTRQHTHELYSLAARPLFSWRYESMH